MSKSLTTKEYIDRANIKHGRYYDYCSVSYTKSKSFINIICPVHGMFKQRASSHLDGHGCKQCAVSKSATIKKSTSFIDNAVRIHANKFNYSLVNYVNNKTKVNIICPTHRSFLQRPDSHLNGHGCPKCALEDKLNTNSKFYSSIRHSHDYIIEKFNNTHQYSYDYTLVKYVNITTPVTVLCPIHGEFYPTPYAHINGSECEMCNTQYNLDLNVSKFIVNSTTVHGGKYSYEKVQYINHHNNVTITCNIHGDFMQLPMVHMRGSGCTQCVNIGVYSMGLIHNSPYMSSLPCIVYFIKLSYNNETFYKIGITRNTVQHRMSSIPKYKGTILYSIQTTLGIGIWLELDILKNIVQYSPIHTFGGYTECVVESSYNFNYVMNKLKLKDIVHG